MKDFLAPFTYVGAGGTPARSKLPPLVSQNSILSWQVRYRIPFMLCGDRSAASRMTLQHLDVVWRLEREDAKQLEREARDAAKEAVRG